MKRGMKSHFRPEKITAVIRPAIMFRLCTKMCNHNHITNVEGGTEVLREKMTVAEEVT